MASFNNQKRPVKPSGESHFIYFCRAVWDALFNGEFPFGNTDTVTFEYTAGKYYFKAKPARGYTPSGSFRGEYDQTQAYTAGDTFKITTPTTISGISVRSGYYGVPPAGTDVLGHVWAGAVPANPTGNAVPQYPLPAIGAAPNDKFYADLISGGVCVDV